MATKSTTSGFLIGADMGFEPVEDLFCETGEMCLRVLRSKVPKLPEATISGKSDEGDFEAFVGTDTKAPFNGVASLVLDYLGFDVSECAGGQPCGNVVIVGQGSTGLTEAEIVRLGDMCEWFSVRDEPPSDGDFSRDPEDLSDSEEEEEEEEEEDVAPAAETKKRPLEEEEEEGLPSKKQKK